MFFFLLTHRSPTSTLFPYTTLFRSGNMIADNAPSIYTAPWSTLFPGLAISLVVLSLNAVADGARVERVPDRKSTRLNSSHITISYAVFCLKKKNKIQ